MEMTAMIGMRFVARKIFGAGGKGALIE